MSGDPVKIAMITRYPNYQYIAGIIVLFSSISSMATFSIQCKRYSIIYYYSFLNKSLFISTHVNNKQIK